MPNETALAAAPVAAWSADVYVQQAVRHADALLGPLTKGCATLLCGPRGVGKSWLALALAHSAARGGALGPWRARSRHRVVYIDVAGSEAVLHARVVALGKPPPSLTLVSGDAQDTGLPDLSLESGRTAIDQLTTDADLVVIDGLSALVRKGRGVGERWSALERWLRSLRRRHVAVLLVDAKEPKPILDVADAVLKVERPADGVREGDLRLQAKLLSSRPDLKDTRRFALRLDLRRNGAVWTYVDDVDHRAIVAYRLDRQDYSSREIARMLDVSPTTAWRLVGRGEKLPPHIRDGVDLEVPEIRKRSRDSESLLPREKVGPTRANAWEDEGPAVADVSADIAETDSCGEVGPSPYPLPRERVPAGDAERAETQTPQPGETVKQPLTRAEREWRTPLRQLMKARGFD
jgi:hypothetical protein